MSQDATKDLIESMRYNKTAFDAALAEISRLKKELREKQQSFHNHWHVLQIGKFEVCDFEECIRIREMTEEPK